MSPRPRGRTAKSDLRERVIEAAWVQIAREGAPALSLRAIARDLGIAAPSIYNYFTDRDALVTALIMEAYESLGTHQLNAIKMVEAHDLKKQITSLGAAYHEWAIMYSQRYQLIFGTPIPGYTAPLDTVAPIAARSLSALITVVERYHQAERLRVVDVDAQTIAVLIWTRVHGVISMEISNNLPPTCSSGSQLFQIEFKLIIDQFFVN